MIIENGTIQVVETTGGGFLNGNPVPVTETLGDPIPCNIRVVKNDKRGNYVDGKFTQTQLVILIELQPFTAKRVKVTDTLRGVDYGTFYVQAIQQLHATGATQIDV